MVILVFFFIFHLAHMETMSQLQFCLICLWFNCDCISFKALLESPSGMSLVHEHFKTLWLTGLLTEHSSSSIAISFIFHAWILGLSFASFSSCMSLALGIVVVPVKKSLNPPLLAWDKNLIFHRLKSSAFLENRMILMARISSSLLIFS